MNIIKYPSADDVDKAVSDKEPLLVMISFDGRKVIMSHIDEAVEHHILLEKVGIDSRDIDKYFRIVLDDEGADWTFICPPDYKQIEDKQRRIKAILTDKQKQALSHGKPALLFIMRRKAVVRLSAAFCGAYGETTRPPPYKPLQRVLVCFTRSADVSILHSFFPRISFPFRAVRQLSARSGR